MKNQKLILIGAAAFIVGILASGAIAAYAVNGNHTGVMNMYAMHSTVSSDEKTVTNASARDMSMDEMTTNLKAKTGDTFDKAFVSEMIVHHQGAIDMANLALANANHQEVKDLAKNIITAQTTEIQQMKDWQTQWGYTSSSMMGKHDMTGM
jgi:uncharacterized protein (DUF305 family)